MSKRSSQNELPPRSSTYTQTFLKTCVLDTDHKLLQKHLKTHPVEQSDLDICLLRGLGIVQRSEKVLSQVARALTILLQSGAKWNSDALLDEQKTPCHIICDSFGDHHKLLHLMIKSSQQTIIDTQDFHKQTALMYAVKNDNINCLKCLIANGANVNIGSEKCPRLVAGEIKSWTPILKAIWVLRRDYDCSSVIMSKIFDLLLDAALDQNKDHFRSCPDNILCAVIAGNVTCIKKLIKKGAPLNSITSKGRYVWAWIAKQGDVELLKCMFDNGFNKDSIDHNGFSVLWWVVVSGDLEAVRYLLELGVVIPTYAPKVRKPHCEKCKENRLIIADNRKQDKQDPCMRAIRDDEVEIVKLLDEYGSECCKSFTALRCAVTMDQEDVVSFLLNKYSYPLNREYTLTKSGKCATTLLKEPICHGLDVVTKLLLDHGADPAKPMCAANSANAIQEAIFYNDLQAMAHYIRGGVDINFRSWINIYGSVVSPFKASVLHHHHHISVMLLVSGCSRGMSSIRVLKDKCRPKLEKLMKEWNVYDDNIVTPLQERCRRVILNQLSPRANMNIRKLSLPPGLIKYLSFPELDEIIAAYDVYDAYGIDRE